MLEMMSKTDPIACSEDLFFILKAKKEVLNLIHDLKVNRLGCISNRYPNCMDEAYLLENFYYFCFPFDDPNVESNILFNLQYFRNYRKVAYNVIHAKFEDAIMSRCFSFVDYVDGEKMRSDEILEFINNNVQRINSNRPFLIRIKSSMPDFGLQVKSPFELVASFTDNYLIRASI